MKQFKQRKDSRKIFLIALGLAGLFFFSSLIFYYVFKSKQRTLLGPLADSDSSVGIELKEVPPPQDVYNVLLLGHGDPGHPGGDLADSLIVVRLDTKDKKAALISVPRDTWVSVQVGGGQNEFHKINEVYMVGKEVQGEEFGFQLIKQAVGEVTGLPIHYFIFINFGKFMELIDGLGGVEVDVPVTFDDYFYPIRGKELESCGWSSEEITAMSATMSGFLLEKQFPCRYEHLHFDAGPTLMDGESALKFVRSRHSDQHGGDFARGERQQALLIGIKDKLLILEALKNIPTIFNQLNQMVKTDLDLEVAGSAAKAIVDPQDYPVTKVVLSTENVFQSSKNQLGQFILIPQAGEDQWEEIHRYIQKNL